MLLTDIIPPRTDRAIFVGQTGSGKTTLARTLLSQRRFVAVFDAKGNIDWPGYKRATTLQRVHELGENPEQNPKIIYAPVHDELAEPEYWNAFFEWVYDRKSTTVYIDEVFSICRREQIPRFYHACLTRGRERHVEVFSSTQRPRSIPSVIKSESENWYVFQLLLEQDRKAVFQTIGILDEEIRNIPQYHFMYAKDSGERFGPLKLKLK